MPEQELLADLAAPALPAASVEEHAFALRQGAAPTSLDPSTSFGKHTTPGGELDVVTAGVTAMFFAIGSEMDMVANLNESTVKFIRWGKYCVMNISATSAPIAQRQATRQRGGNASSCQGPVVFATGRCRMATLALYSQM